MPLISEGHPLSLCRYFSFTAVPYAMTSAAPCITAEKLNRTLTTASAPIISPHSKGIIATHPNLSKFGMTYCRQSAANKISKQLKSPCRDALPELIRYRQRIDPMIFSILLPVRLPRGCRV